MSLDLDWDSLDKPLAASIMDMLNRTLEHVARPSFIGPVQVLSFDFGTAPPDIELVDMRDIYRDFLEDDFESEDDEIGSGSGARGGSDDQPLGYTRARVDLGSDDEEYEWVSRRRVPHSTGDASPSYHALPPHVRYGGMGRGPVQDVFASMPPLRSPPRETPWASTTGLGMLSPSMYRSPFPMNPLAALATPLGFQHTGMMPTPRSTQPPSVDSPPSPTPQTRNISPQSLIRHKKADVVPEPTLNKNPHPDLQLHLRVHWPSKLRLTLTTSLVINVPAPGFLALPIKLTVTGLLFTGELVVAYEGSRRRIHVCIVDELDPYCPLSSGGGGPSSMPGIRRMSTFGSLDEQSPEEEEPTSTATTSGDADGGDGGFGTNKPPRVGQRVLQRVTIESEIGQADKHVLRNVKRVERFVQDVIRDTLENELVFPNFHTLVLGEA